MDSDAADVVVHDNMESATSRVEVTSMMDNHVMDSNATPSGHKVVAVTNKMVENTKKNALCYFYTKSLAKLVRHLKLN